MSAPVTDEDVARWDRLVKSGTPIDPKNIPRIVAELVRLRAAHQPCSCDGDKPKPKPSHPRSR